MSKEIIVLNTDNYKNGEKGRFIATLIEVTNHPCFIVESYMTKRRYELYHHQIAEFKDIEEDFADWWSCYDKYGEKDKEDFKLAKEIFMEDMQHNI